MRNYHASDFRLSERGMEKPMSSLMKENLRGPVLTIDNLCKFVRGHFGPAAAEIAQQHVDAYKRRGQNDVASTWSNVRDQLKKDDLITKRVA